uniref:Uncharacterized protein n=1 Tax=Anguilla anguilla TaxID=7936 RepID=A0A0E9WT65_ANGAN
MLANPRKRNAFHRRSFSGITCTLLILEFQCTNFNRWRL